MEGMSVKDRSAKRKKKYQSKLSALIKGLNAIGKDLEDKFKTSASSRQHNLKTNKEIMKKDYSSCKSEIDKIKSKLNKGNQYSTDSLGALAKQNYSCEELPKRESSLTKQFLTNDSNTSGKHKYCMSLVKSNPFIAGNLYIKVSPRNKSKGKSTGKLKATIPKRSKIQSYLKQTNLEQNNFNSPLSDFLKKHKEYRAKKVQHLNSVELTDLYRDGSIDKNPFTKTVVLRPDEELLTDPSKPQTNRRSKYLTNKKKVTQISKQ
jgi:hypothetical protein